MDACHHGAVSLPGWVLWDLKGDCAMVCLVYLQYQWVVCLCHPHCSTGPHGLARGTWQTSKGNPSQVLPAPPLSQPDPRGAGWI